MATFRMRSWRLWIYSLVVLFIYSTVTRAEELAPAPVEVGSSAATQMSPEIAPSSEPAPMGGASVPAIAAIPFECRSSGCACMGSAMGAVDCPEGKSYSFGLDIKDSSICDFATSHHGLCDDELHFEPATWHTYKSIFWGDMASVWCSLDERERKTRAENCSILAISSALALYCRYNWDDEVADSTFAHPDRWGSGFNDTFEVLGNPGIQFASTGLIYAAGRCFDDPKLADFGVASFNSLIATNLTVLVLKGTFDTTRPDGGSFGFPSGNTASSFALAACADEYYGRWVGLGAYTLAGLVAWQQIDSRHSDVSDILVATSIGIVIGKSIAIRHHFRALRHCEELDQVGLYLDPERNLTGLCWSTEY